MFFNDEGKNLRAIAAGDTAALRNVYLQYKDDIYRYALSITKNHHMAEDVLQDTIIKIQKKAHTYNGGKAKSWVMRIAHNTAIDLIKNAHYEVQSDLTLQHSEDVLDEFAEIIRLLPDELDRKIVGLRIDGGFKNKEVAELLGMNYKDVSRRYNSALDILRKKLS